MVQEDVRRPYVDFAYYKNDYGGTQIKTENDFKRAESISEAFVNQVTFGRIARLSSVIDVVAGQWLFDTFSFRQGIILKETIEELAKLRQHDEDFVTVTEYADNTIRGTDRTKHWRIGGA